ncbi:MAG: 50S ribosomal protein L14e [Promethearchaeota archaeon]
MSVNIVGRIVVKTHGREKGRRCVVVERIDKNFVLVTGPQELTGVRRRRANVDHITPTEHKVEIDSGADDKAVTKAITAAKLGKFMKGEK